MSIISRKSAPTTSEPLGLVDELPILNSCYTGFPLTELQPKDQDYKGERTIALEKNSQDGIKPMTKEEQDFERQLNWQLIKKFTMAIFKMDVTRFSFPVGYSEPRTFLERSVDLFTFLVQGYVDRAIATPDPAKRLAIIGAGVIAGFHLYLQQKKPWNPVIGETFVGRWPNGVSIYGEQTSHHPPISALQLFPPNGGWNIEGICKFEVDPGITQVNILQHGDIKLHLPDGSLLEWEFPTISVVGLLRGDRIVKVKGPLEIIDHTNQLQLHVDIAPKKDAKKGLPKPRTTTIWGGVYSIPEYERLKKPKDLPFIVSITGDYADKVLINDEVVWTLESDIVSRPYCQIPDEDLLLSDCRYRLDRSLLIRNEMEKADNAKTLVEVAQRKDAALRADYEKEAKKANKKRKNSNAKPEPTIPRDDSMQMMQEGEARAQNMGEEKVEAEAKEILEKEQS